MTGFFNLTLIQTKSFKYLLTKIKFKKTTSSPKLSSFIVKYKRYMNRLNIHAELATSYLSLPTDKEVVEWTKERLRDKKSVGSFLSSSVLREYLTMSDEIGQRLVLHFQKMTLFLDVVLHKKNNRQFVNSFQIV